MTALILRPDRRITARKWVSTVDAHGTELPLGYIQATEHGYRTHADGRTRTREAVVHLVAECAGLAGPYHVEELAARVRRVVRCARGVAGRVTVRLA